MIPQAVSRAAAAWVAGLVVAVALGGCVAPAVDTAPREVEVRAPLPGEWAAYAGDVTYEVTVRDPVGAYDARGGPVVALPVHARLRSVDRYTEYAWFHDSTHRAFLVATPCKALGLGMAKGDPPCAETGRIDGTFVEFDVPSVFGASWFWGATLRPGPWNRSISFFNHEYRAEYEVEVEGDPPCARVRAAILPDLVLHDQRFTRTAGFPEFIEFCGGSPFATVARLADGRDFERRHERLAHGTPPALGTAADPWSAPLDPRAAGPKGRVPFSERWDPTGYSLPEAYEDFLASDVGRAFLAEHPEAALRHSGLGRFSPEFVPEEYGIRSEPGRVERTLALTGRDVVLEATVQRDCAATVCRASVSVDREHRAEVAVDARALRTMALPAVSALANATLQRPVMFFTVGAVSRGGTDETPEFATNDSLFYSFYAWDDRGAGVPFCLRLDGGRGMVLSFGLPEEAAKRLVGDVFPDV